MNDDVLQKWIKESDIGGDGRTDFNEFLRQRKEQDDFFQDEMYVFLQLIMGVFRYPSKEREGREDCSFLRQPSPQATVTTVWKTPICKRGV